MSEPQISRRTDPITSHVGAREITDSGRRQSLTQRAARFVCENPGLPRAVIAAHLDVTEYALSKRLSDAEAKGLIRKAGSVRVDNRPQSLWWPARPAQGEQERLL